MNMMISYQELVRTFHSIPPHNMSKSADFLEREEYNNSAVFN